MLRKIICLPLSLLFLSAVSSAAAQTLFEIPKMDSLLEKYSYVEECIALGQRFRAQYRIRSDTSRFSSPLDKPQVFLDDIKVANDIAARCMKKFDVNTVDITPDSLTKPYKSVEWINGYLIARDYSSVKSLISREYELIDRDSMESIMAYHWELIRLYDYNMRPLNLDVLDSLIEYVRLPVVQKTRDPNAFTYYANALSLAMERRWNHGDRSGSINTAKFLKALLDSFSITESEREALTSQNALSWRGMVPRIEQILTHAQVMDTLRIAGPKSYISERQRMWKLGEHFAFGYPLYVGEEAAAITPQFFIPENREDGSGSKEDGIDSIVPRSGRMSLLVFLPNACRPEGANTGEDDLREFYAESCWDSYGIIRRLKHTFPNLDLTIVTQTLGVIGKRVTRDSVDEFNWIKRLWRDVHKLPVNVSVVYTDYMRLGPPDNRRVDIEPDYMKAYFGFPMFFGEAISNRFAFVVSPDRQILSYFRLTPEGESELNEFLGAAMGWYDKVYRNDKESGE